MAKIIIDVPEGRDPEDAIEELKFALWSVGRPDTEKMSESARLMDEEHCTKGRKAGEADG